MAKSQFFGKFTIWRQFALSICKLSNISGLFFVHILRHFNFWKYNPKLGYLDGVSSVCLLLPPRQPSRTKRFLSWLGALRWHRPSRQRKLPRCQLSGEKAKYVLSDYSWVLGSFRGWQRDNLWQGRAPSRLRKPSLGRWKEQGNGRDSIQVSKFTTIFFTE